GVMERFELDSCRIQVQPGAKTVVKFATALPPPFALFVGMAGVRPMDCDDFGHCFNPLPLCSANAPDCLHAACVSLRASEECQRVATAPSIVCAPPQKPSA